MKKNVGHFKKNNAITLIALVVTIIILLILAGVTIGVATNGTGLFEKAQQATEKYNNAVEKENIKLGETVNQIDSYIAGNRTDIANILEVLNGYTVVSVKGSTHESASISTSYTAEQNGIAIGISFAYSAYGTSYTSTSITSTGTQIQQEITNTKDRNKYSFAIYKLATGDTISVSGAGNNGEINLNSACGIILFKPIDI